MQIILTSTSAVAPDGTPLDAVVDALVQATSCSLVGLVSSHSKPDWFDTSFGGTKVQFLKGPSRQSGNVIKVNTKKFDLKPHDVIVLAGCQDDIAMGKNGGAILVAAGWIAEPKVQDLGIRAGKPSDFLEIIRLTSAWQGGWWFSGNGDGYGVRALADLSSIYGTDEQIAFAKRLTSTVKNGGPKLNALLSAIARSLLQEGIGTAESLFWGVYPSSKSTNDDSDVLSDFTHRLRTVTSQVQMARRDHPLFIRHQPTARRSKSSSGDRNNPTAQIESIHLNPEYRGKLRKRNVVIVDDCVTYGVSFGVAAAFLTKAGANSVTGVALGKFGNCLHEHQIEIASDPFEPVLAGGYVVNHMREMESISNKDAKVALKDLIG